MTVMILRNRSARYAALGISFVIILLYLFSGMILTSLGEFLVVDERPVHADAAVVLNSGVEYYPRLLEAAHLYRQGFVEKIVINGNRKSETLRWLEGKGFNPCCPWYENRVRILEMMGVPEKDVLAISAEDAYDTVSEAEEVGQEILKKGFLRIIVTTSKYHTRRARFIWSKLYGDRMTVSSVSAKSDPYDPRGWWKEGPQIRWVMAEYGGWAYDRWKLLRGGWNQE